MLFAKIKYVRNEKSFRQTKSETDGKSEREANRLRGRQTERHIDRETYRYRDRKTDWQRHGPLCIIP
jgi:hypothetical protein